MNIKLYSSFPEGWTPNEAQEYILSELSKALDTDHKFIIIQAPTASGKSMISKTLANYSNEPDNEYIKLVKTNRIFNPGCQYDPHDHQPWGAAILTCTKSLQDQYGRTFDDGTVAKGKINYQCAVDAELTCERGFCSISPGQKEKCMGCHLCPYYNTLANALVNKTAFYSYSMYGCMFPKVKHRQFIVCDEASELEAEIVGEYTSLIDFKRLKKIIGTFPVTPDSYNLKTEWWRWMRMIGDQVETVYTNLQLDAKNKKKKLSVANQTKLFMAEQMLQNINVVLDAWDLTDYIICGNVDGVEFKPYNIDKLAKTFFSYGERIVLMSATIVDPKRFAKTLGIDDYYYIEADCQLDPKKAPILCSCDTYLSYKNKWQVLPKILDRIETICKKYHNKKGLIHTHTMEILKYLRENLTDKKRFIYREEGVNNESLLVTHSETSDPTVMVSPSMTHGVDLKGDLGEFQVIIKAPYPPLGDPRVKRKFEEDRQWYVNCMLSTLIQASGRCNRTKEDQSVTFIMDTNAVDAIKANRHLLPKYFIERFL